MQLKGEGGRSGWQWIFIVSSTEQRKLCSPYSFAATDNEQIEGIMTCALAGVSALLLIDFPEKSPKSWRFINEEEAAFVVQRLENDRADVHVEPFSVKSYLSHGSDGKVWAYGFMFLLTTTNTYAIAYFLPIILQHSMGFSVAKAQCLVAPPYVAAAIVMFTQAAFADKYRIRGPVIVGNGALGLLGLGLLGYLSEPAPRYFGVFLATIGCKFKSFFKVIKSDF